MKAGSSSSSSASSLSPILFVNFGGRLKKRLWTGEEDDDDSALDDGDERGSGCGERCGERGDGSFPFAGCA